MLQIKEKRDKHLPISEVPIGTIVKYKGEYYLRTKKGTFYNGEYLFAIGLDGGSCLSLAETIVTIPKVTIKQHYTL